MTSDEIIKQAEALGFTHHHCAGITNEMRCWQGQVVALWNAATLAERDEGEDFGKRLGAWIPVTESLPESGKPVLAAERERYKKAFQKMRNVAAGYSNLCDDSGSTRRLEREFTEAEEMFRALGE